MIRTIDTEVPRSLRTLWRPLKGLLRTDHTVHTWGAPADSLSTDRRAPSPTYRRQDARCAARRERVRERVVFAGPPVAPPRSHPRVDASPLSPRRCHADQFFL